MGRYWKYVIGKRKLKRNENILDEKGFGKVRFVLKDCSKMEKRR
jgi:hypothetical protein